MNINHTQIRSYRLHAHHLDQKLPADHLITAASVCGLQNSPPGTWETAMFNRLKGCTPDLLQDALYRDKTLLQAWSFRGAPVIFPTEESDVFLTPLTAQEGEYPWIYTRGISGALDFMQMSFEDLLTRTKEAVRYLDSHTIKSKEALDRTLAAIIQDSLPEEKQPLWTAPSMYGSPDRQTVGGAAVSFLLRPCSFASLIVFGQRQGISPTFTSFENWIGHPPVSIPDAGKALTRKFLHSYGPATKASFMDWLGCSPKQAQRLWDTVADEVVPVTVGNQTCYLLIDDLETLLSSDAYASEINSTRLLLLGPHDPYLDIRDRDVLLEDKSLQRTVWKTVANPGAILKDGRIIGTWTTKTQKTGLDISMRLFEIIRTSEQDELRLLAENYSAFRSLSLKNCTIDCRC